MFRPFLNLRFPLVFLVFIASAAQAEFICRSQISYKWKKAQEEAEAEVPYSAIEAKGADEAAAKKGLEEPADLGKHKAWKECQKEHENMTGCVAGRFAGIETTLQRLTFSQRKAIEEAISTDCAARQGKCGSVTAGEPQCSEVVKAAAGGTPAADEKKADKGKKK